MAGRGVHCAAQQSSSVFLFLLENSALAGALKCSLCACLHPFRLTKLAALLVQDGTCQGEAEQCVAGYSCCATTPALYCQKNLANQLLGTCEKVSRVRACA